MEQEKLQNTVFTLENELKKYEKKEFNVYFFVLDTKGNPSGTLRYIYQTAKTLADKGYKVTMLHQEKEFVGVADWLGEEFASLPHKNVEKENVEIGAGDFLFVPEIYANVMSQTKNLPCKRVVILSNLNYLTEVIPVGVTWNDMGINDVVTISKAYEATIKDYFPDVEAHVVSPYIPEAFKKNEKPKNLIVNCICKNPSDINKVIKPFFWKYPVYKWVSFRDLRGLPQDTFAEALRDSALTIWIDDETSFGLSLIESIKCRCLTFAKVPDNVPEWMVDENNTLSKAAIWFDNIKNLPDMIAGVVRAWLVDNIPAEFEEEAAKIDALYTKDEHVKQVEETYVDGFFKERENEINEAIKQFKAQLNNDEK